MRILTRDFEPPGFEQYMDLRYDQAMEPQPGTSGVKQTRPNTVIIKDEPRPIYSQEELSMILTEPLPNLWEVFKSYNEELFSNEIKGFSVRWCSRLKSVAGKTVLRPFPKITLSKTLLVGREIRVMVETLLYEMIHGFLFCTTHVNTLRHGEDFVKLMTGINQVTNLNVSILDEGGLNHIAHLQVIWQCTNCKREIVRFKRKSDQPRDATARRHSMKCRGSWVIIG